MTDLINNESFGAWLLKCNPDVFDLPRMLEAGLTPEEWSVQDNYRSHRMKAGDPVILWMTGRRSNTPSGVWAVGHLKGPVDVEVEIAEADEEGFWIDEDRRLRARFLAPVELEFLTEPITRAVVQATPGLAEMEVFTSPANSNPNWLTVDEWNVMRDLLGSSAPLPMTESEKEAIKGEPSPSETDPLTKMAVEHAAIRTVWDSLEAQGWVIEDRQDHKIGWDLTATKGAATRLIEVKGRGTAAVSVMLTVNEVNASRNHAGWELAVVTTALTRPQLHWIPADEVAGNARPITYRFDSPESTTP